MSASTRRSSSASRAECTTMERKLVWPCARVCVPEVASLLEGGNNSVLTNHCRGEEHQDSASERIGGDIRDAIEPA